MSAKIGERVRACVNGTGIPQPGVVTAVMTGSALKPSPQYMVQFDGSRQGHSGPCFYVVPA